MPSFRWLHLTDLHLGAPKQKALWTDNVLTDFLDDLARHRDRLGGMLDLVCFTGDLVFSGTKKEFEALDLWLQHLYKKFEQRGLGRPYFLAVPGNHDLVRPTDASAARALIDGFSDDRTLTVPPLVKAAFAPYVAFWKRLKLPRPELSHGIMPGDFATTIDCEGYQLGVVGLNSAALHLTGDDDLAGKMVLSEDQLSAVCGGDVGAWFKERHATLLLSHHPPAWLRERTRFETELSRPGRFVAHLCGHLHEPDVEEVSKGDGPPQRRWLGRSFFGLDKIRGEIQRSHGYRVGVLRFDGTENAGLSALPRAAHRREDGTFGFGREERSDYEGDAPQTAERRVPLAAPPPPLMNPQPAGTPYDPSWYIRRGQEERAQRMLEEGTPLLVLGPARYGKSYFIKHVAAALSRSGAFRCITVDCGGLSGTSDELLWEFALQLAGDDTGLQRALTKRWEEKQLPTKARLRKFLVQDILKPTSKKVLLVLDHTDRVLEHAGFSEVAELLRALLADEKYDARLRLVVAAATTRMAYDVAASALLDSLTLIELKDLSREQIATLAARYGRFATSDIDGLIAHVAGHPNLLRSYFFEAVIRGSTLGKVIRDPAFSGQLVRRMRKMLSAPVADQAAVSRWAQGDPAPLAEKVSDWLRRTGLLTDDGARLRCEFYRQLFLPERGR